MIFDVKMDFSRKARYVAGGHTTDPPNAVTFASVVSRESVRIALMIAALNDLEGMTADTRNAYLNAPIAEKVGENELQAPKDVSWEASIEHQSLEDLERANDFKTP
jgi:hypothetical protein